jgi:DNA-binding XRE family transcriptional regulator
MRFGSPEFFEYLKKLQSRAGARDLIPKRHSFVEVAGALGVVKLSFETHLSPRLRRAIIRGFFRHNKDWLRYFRSISLEHLEHVSTDPLHFVARGLPLFRGETFESPLGRLGTEIQLRRLNLGWSQSELARRSGVPQSHISKIERGLIRVQKTTHARLMRAMAVRRTLSAEDLRLCE